MNRDIQTAIDQINASAPRYARTERYYRGEHYLAFASQKFQNAFGSLFREFAMNLCPAICDAVRDKLKVTGFRVNAAGDEMPHDAIWRIWQRNRMAARSAEVHGEAVRNGDAWVIVWPDAEGLAHIHANRSAAITAFYDDEDGTRMLWAAKTWRTRQRATRLNLYYPDRVERYVSARGTEASSDARGFVPFRDGGAAPVVANPFGRVPVFHFANNAGLGVFGSSELEPAIPIQDGLNKAVLDMLVAMEFCAYRQRWAAGIEIEYDKEGKAAAPFKAGIDHLWISENPQAKFGDFESADLEQFLKVKDGFRVDMASVTGTPLYYLMPHVRGFPSGESLRKVETRFIAKVRARQETFGDVWGEVMEFAARIEGIPDLRVSTAWEDPSPLTDREALQNLLLKRRLGISAAQVLREAGYGDVDVRRMAQEE
jgi:hypothetical protein